MALSSRFWKLLGLALLVAVVVLTIGLFGSRQGGSVGTPQPTSQTG